MNENGRLGYEDPGIWRRGAWLQSGEGPVSCREGRDTACAGELGEEIQKNGLRIKDNIEGYRAIRNAGHEILPKADTEFEGAAYRKTCLRFFKLMCATSLGKICASDHAMNAVEEMSALNRDLKGFFDANGAEYPVWRELEKDAGRYLIK